MCCVNHIDRKCLVFFWRLLIRKSIFFHDKTCSWHHATFCKDTDSLYIWQSELPMISFLGHLYVWKCPKNRIFRRKHDRKIKLLVLHFVRCRGYEKFFFFHIFLSFVTFPFRKWHLKDDETKTEIGSLGSQIYLNIHFFFQTTMWNNRQQNWYIALL